MIEGIEERIIIVGGGPIGLYCSYLIKKQNPSLHVLVIEEHEEIGVPQNCTGLISIKGYNKTELSKLIDINKCLLNKIKGANIYSPYKEKFTVQTKEDQAYLIDREKFDKLIYKLAKNNNVEFLFNRRVIDIDSKNNKVFVKDLKNNNTNKISFNFVIASDGPNSIIRDKFYKNFNKKEFIQTYQVIAKGDFNKKLANLYFSKFSKSFFAWLVPINNYKVKVGIGTRLGNNPKSAFNNFLKEFKLNITSFDFESSALIPIHKPLDNFVIDNKIILLGDAACFVKSASGGGINFGLLSCQVAAKAIYQRLNNFKNLDVYNKLIKEYTFDLKLHYRIYNFLHIKNNYELDLFIKKCNKAKIDKFLEKHANMDFVSSFIFKLAFYPRIYIFFKDFLDLIKIKK